MCSRVSYSNCASVGERLPSSALLDEPARRMCGFESCEASDGKAFCPTLYNRVYPVSDDTYSPKKFYQKIIWLHNLHKSICMPSIQDQFYKSLLPTFCTSLPLSLEASACLTTRSSRHVLYSLIQSPELPCL